MDTKDLVLVGHGPIHVIALHGWFGHARSWGHFPSEIDDSGQPTEGCGSCAHLNPMLNAESIQNQDIVVWYGAHWTHDHFDAPQHSDGPYVHGPDLILQKY